MSMGEGEIKDQWQDKDRGGGENTVNKDRGGGLQGVGALEAVRTLRQTGTKGEPNTQEMVNDLGFVNMLRYFKSSTLKPFSKEHVATREVA